MRGLFVHHAERELDVVEMAVHGNVNRFGLKCKCRTVGEMMHLVGERAMSKPFMNYSP